MEADGVRAMVAWLGTSPGGLREGGSRSGGAGGEKRSRSCAWHASFIECREERSSIEASVLHMSWSEVAAQVGDEISPTMLRHREKGGRLAVDAMVRGPDAWA